MKAFLRTALWGPLSVLLLLLLSGPGIAAADGPNAMAVDATSGGSVDNTRTVTGTATFDVDVVVTTAGTAYNGYQDALSFDTSVVQADTVTQVPPAGFSTCGAKAIDNTTNPGTAYDYGCLKFSAPGWTFTGTVTTVTLHCVGNGTSALHLITLAEDPDFGTTTLDAGGGIINTGLTNAEVTCQSVATPNAAPLARWTARLWGIMAGTGPGALP